MKKEKEEIEYSVKYNNIGYFPISAKERKRCKSFIKLK